MRKILKEKHSRKKRLIGVSAAGVKKSTEVPVAVIRRLPRYHRFLGELLRREISRISSAELSEIMGVTASQIRQDLNCFGGFGQQGYGYNVEYLYETIGSLLGVDEGYTAVIVGAGNLGRALVNSHMFERRGVKRVAMFDVDPAIVGKTVNGIPVYGMDTLEDYFQKQAVDIAVLTTPKDAAEGVALRLARAGVKGIWNFSNMELAIPECPEVLIENIHMGDSLMLLCYRLKDQEDKRKEKREDLP